MQDLFMFRLPPHPNTSRRDTAPAVSVISAMWVGHPGRGVPTGTVAHFCATGVRESGGLIREKGLLIREKGPSVRQNSLLLPCRFLQELAEHTKEKPAAGEQQVFHKERREVEKRSYDGKGSSSRLLHPFLITE